MMLEALIDWSAPWTFAYFTNLTYAQITIFTFVIFFLCGINNYIMGKRNGFYLSFFGAALMFCMMIGIYNSVDLDPGSAAILVVLVMACAVKALCDYEYKDYVENKPFNKKRGF